MLFLTQPTNPITVACFDYLKPCVGLCLWYRPGGGGCRTATPPDQPC